MATKKKTKVSPATVRPQATAKLTIGTAPKPMRVKVTRIRLYERNPRRGRNPEYERIKSSILNAGMDQPLRITQRPGDKDYVVQAGGNTRLKILKELNESNNDERFYWVDCLFVKWDSESAVLLAHLRENELRGNLNFIDRAQGVMDVKRMIAEESRRGHIPKRDLERLLRNQGYSISHGLISLMSYGQSRLLPLMPTALDAGLGKHQVQRIRKLERVGQEVWNLREAGPPSEFPDVFEALCRRYDGQDWQFEPLRRAVEVEIAEAAEVSIQLIRMEFDCRLAGQEPQIPEHVLREEVTFEVFPVSPRDEPDVMSVEEKEALLTEEMPDEGAAPELTGRSGAVEHQPPQIAVEWPVETTTDAVFRRIGSQSKDRIPLELLRNTAYDLAQRLARRHGLAELISPLEYNGLGFLVAGIPPADIMEQLDDDLLGQVSTMWWQLLAFSELVAAPSQPVIANDNGASDFVSATCSGNIDHLIDQVETLHPGYLAQRFVRLLSHEDWCDWLCLAHNYRELHRMSKLLNTPLWSPST